MKFICENCKAKYQIGDDKIAGRSVRMKCRRCGHLIQLSASVTAGDGGAGTADTSASAPHETVEPSAVESTSSASMKLAELLAAQPPDDLFDEGPTRAMTLDQRAAASKTGSAQGAPAPAPRPVPAPLPPPAAPAGPARPTFAARPGGVAAPGAAPGVARPAGPAAPGAAPGVARPGIGAARPATTLGIGAPRPATSGTSALPNLPAVRPPATGVTGAYQKAAAAGAEPSKPASGAATTGHVPHGEDWYVGVGGVPLGPVRLAVIREKALTGAVHADSLVWREGFDEWQPLKQFPELLQIVEDAQASRGAPGCRPSVVPPPTRPSALPPVKPPSIAPPPAKLPPTAKPFQPKATAMGLGMPAVTVPANVAATLPSSGAPVAPRTTKSALPAPTPPPAAPPAAAPVAPLAQTGAAPAARAGLGSALAARPAPGAATPPAVPPPAEPDFLSELMAPPAAPAPAPFVPEARPASELEPAELEPALAATAVSAGTRDVRQSAPRIEPTRPAATDDLFGLGGGEAPAEPTGASAPAPVVPAPSPLPSGALDVMRDPFAPPAPGANGAAGAASAAPSPAPAPAPAPAARPSITDREEASRPSVGPASVPPPQLVPAGVPRRGMHPLAYAFIAMAAAFGGVVAFLLFSKPPQPTIVYVPQPGASTAALGAGTAAPVDTATAAPTGASTTEPSSAPKPVLGKGPGPAPTSSAASAPLDTSGFGNQVVPGPTATQTSTGPDPSLGQLSPGEIQGVVSANQPRIRKRCWQPALDSAGPNATGNARVTGKIVIGPSGAVQSATASGAEKDYPGLSSCIAAQMQGWRFPPSGGTTPVNVPFVFAGN